MHDMGQEPCSRYVCGRKFSSKSSKSAGARIIFGDYGWLITRREMVAHLGTEWAAQSNFSDRNQRATTTPNRHPINSKS